MCSQQAEWKPHSLLRTSSTADVKQHRYQSHTEGKCGTMVKRLKLPSLSPWWWVCEILWVQMADTGCADFLALLIPGVNCCRHYDILLHRPSNCTWELLSVVWFQIPYDFPDTSERNLLKNCWLHYFSAIFIPRWKPWENSQHKELRRRKKRQRKVGNCGKLLIHPSLSAMETHRRDTALLL